jgi:acetyl esterase/lipase
MTTLNRPPYDPELNAFLLANPHLATSLTPEMIAFSRPYVLKDTAETIVAQSGATHREYKIAGHLGDEILVSVFTPSSHTGPARAILNLHGGGMVVGDRFLGLNVVMPWAEEFHAVVVSVEYRLAPEFPDPYPVEDCYAALEWLATHADELGVDARRVLLFGGSAGGGLAAGVALLARDRQGPVLLGQMLLCPMLDDRDETVSCHQFSGIGVWDRMSNQTGWDALLGQRRGTEAVSIYAAPARATDLSALPPTFIEVGSAEVFRDEDVAYASRIWAGGGNAELHVWPGGFHGFEGSVPHAAISQEARIARKGWISRLFSD